MKIKIANTRKKQSVELSQIEPIGAIAKYKLAQSDHSSYQPKAEKQKEAETSTPKIEYDIQAQQKPSSDAIEPEIITSIPTERVPYNARLTKRCINCGELVSKTDKYCWKCRTPTNNHQNYNGGFNQTIIIKERRGGGCLRFTLGLILFIILLPFILYLIGAISIATLFGLFS